MGIWYDLSLTRAERVAAYAEAGYPAIIDCGFDESATCQLADELRSWAWVEIREAGVQVHPGYISCEDAVIAAEDHQADCDSCRYVVLDTYGMTAGDIASAVSKCGSKAEAARAAKGENDEEA